MQTGLLGEQPGDGGFADAGRPPQDERGEAGTVEHPREKTLRAEQVILPDHGIERGGAQPFGEGHGAARRDGRVLREQIGTGRRLFHARSGSDRLACLREQGGETGFGRGANAAFGDQTRH